jgi:hypothetical protein
MTELSNRFHLIHNPTQMMDSLKSKSVAGYDNHNEMEYYCGVDSRLDKSSGWIREVCMKWLHNYILPTLVAMHYIRHLNDVRQWNIVFTSQKSTTVFEWNGAVRSITPKPMIVGFNILGLENKSLITYKIAGNLFSKLGHNLIDSSPLIAMTMGISLDQWGSMQIPTPAVVLDNPASIAVDNEERDEALRKLKILCRSTISDLFNDSSADTRKWCDGYVDDELTVFPVEKLNNMLFNLSAWVPKMMSAYNKRKIT